MTLLAEIAVSALLVAAGLFGLVGSVGLIKLPDPMMRLHAPTKATTLGVGGVLIASMLYFFAFGGGLSWHELMITLFLLLTAPITAHFLAKAVMHRTLRAADLPPAQGGSDWMTYTHPDHLSGPDAEVQAERVAMQAKARAEDH